MSIAFGAFLAGLMISESEYSHNAFANLLPFKDTFTSFFFVSIGMLLDVSFIIANPFVVILSVVMVIVLKTIFAGGTGFLLGHTFKGTVLVGIALCQVGEFSFILAKIGYQLEIINDFIYQLFLAVAVITMALTPFLMKLSTPLANVLLRMPLPKFLVEGLFPLKEISIPVMQNHLVIIGKDASAMKLSLMARHFNMSHVSLVFDPLLAKEKMDRGDNVIYGDAVNEPILLKAYADQADTVVVSVGSIIPSMAIIEKVRKINPKVRIIARAHRIKNVSELYKLGADEVLPEKLEIAIDLFNRVLTSKLLPMSEINRMLAQLRSKHLGEYTSKDSVNKLSIFDELSNTNISAIKIQSGSEADGKTIKELKLRKNTGITLLAIKRGGKIIEHPNPITRLEADDVAYVLGNPEQINAAGNLFSAVNEPE
jgi:CPA2 family monovalent cation:H+ antiporter-2